MMEEQENQYDLASSLYHFYIYLQGPPGPKGDSSDCGCNGTMSGVPGTPVRYCSSTLSCGFILATIKSVRASLLFDQIGHEGTTWKTWSIRNERCHWKTSKMMTLNQLTLNTIRVHVVLQENLV